MSAESSTRRLAVEVTAWRALERGTLLGFVEVFIPQLKLHIADISVHRHENGRMWCGLPAKPRLDRDGNLVRAATGKPEYSKVLWFGDRAVSDAFSAAVIAALDRYRGGERAA